MRVSHRIRCGTPPGGARAGCACLPTVAAAVQLPPHLRSSLPVPSAADRLEEAKSFLVVGRAARRILGVMSVKFILLLVVLVLAGLAGALTVGTEGLARDF